ncbi:hypothetical protein [Mycoplasma sp. E35C]|uniref:hypothetical protein n=1 Tax=Mycoplasma sp. E35C TaxID=2801918 RepID=UPI001CA4150F|nr:hypothetical protein [Mycoplasma sp. E35C]QZX48982.1 hypothetical protein JJE79_02910 [Mycoplasma sp. E35C]
MKRTKRILFSLGGVLPVVGGMILSSCSQMPAKSSKPYEFSADAEFRAAAFGNINTIQQVNNVISQSLQLTVDQAPKKEETDKSKKPEVKSKDEAAGKETAGKEGESGSKDKTTQSSSVTLLDDAAPAATQQENGSKKEGEEQTTKPQTEEQKDNKETPPKEQENKGFWKHVLSIADKFEKENDKKDGRDNIREKTRLGLLEFAKNFSTKLKELVAFGGDNQEKLIKGTASLEELKTAKASFETKWKALFEEFNTLAKLLETKVTFDTTKPLSELVKSANITDLMNLFKANSKSVYEFAKPTKNSYNDLARFFEAVNGGLGNQFTNNVKEEDAFRLFGGIMALILDREQRTIDGAINAVALTTPENKSEAVQDKVFENISSNSDIVSRLSVAKTAIANFKKLSDQWSSNEIFKKDGNKKSSFELAMEAVTGDTLLNKVNAAFYGDAKAQNALTKDGIYKSLTDLETAFKNAESKVGKDGYANINDFIDFYKLTGSTWRGAVGIFLNTNSLNDLNDDKVNALSAKQDASEESKKALETVKTQLKTLISQTKNMWAGGVSGAKDSGFYLNHMVRSVTSDSQAVLAVLGKDTGNDKFVSYSNTLIE